jgi:hypothetical protein
VLRFSNQARVFAVALVVAAALPADRTECVRTLERESAATERALARFESSGSTDVAKAREVLAAATSDRNRLEKRKVSSFCDPSRAEDLIFLNHLTLGFTGWIAARSRRPAADYELASIIRRARAHRDRGRSRLR